jgi:hypothetical protein
MSNEMQLFKQGGGVPEYLKGGSSDLTRTLAGGDSIKRVSIRGGVFRMMVGSKELAINEDRSMNFIVVAAAAAIARTFYDGAYQEGVDATPVCWSDDGFKPSDKAIKAQAAACAMCPKNAKGSGAGDSRACRFSARLAVALEGDLQGGVYGISIPAMSLFGDSVGRYSPLQDYARKLAQHNVSMEKVVTEFRFDTKAQVPKLVFQAVRPLTKEEYAQVQELQDEDLSTLIGPREFSPPKDEAAATPYSADAEEDEEEELDAVEQDEDEDEEEEAPPPPKPKATRGRPAKNSNKAATKPVAKAVAVDDDDDMADMLREWADD